MGNLSPMYYIWGLGHAEERFSLWENMSAYESKLMYITYAEVFQADVWNARGVRTIHERNHVEP